MFTSLPVIIRHHLTIITYLINLRYSSSLGYKILPLYGQRSTHYVHKFLIDLVGFNPKSTQNESITYYEAPALPNEPGGFHYDLFYRFHARLLVFLENGEFSSGNQNTR
jgi:hypothetical protein